MSDPYARPTPAAPSAASRDGAARIQRATLLQGALGAAAGFALWGAAWVLHQLLFPHATATSDPMFWMLGTAPLWTASLGWALSERDRLERTTHRMRRVHDHVTTQAAAKEAVARSVLRDSYDAVMLAGVGGVVLDANEPAAALFGVTPGGFSSLRISALLPQIPADDTFLESGQTPGGPGRVEWRTRARHSNGQVFDVDVRLSRVDSAAQVFTIRRVARNEPDGKRIAETRRRGTLLQIVGASMRARFDQILGSVDLSDDPQAGAAVQLLADLDQLEQIVLWDRGLTSPTVAPLDPVELLRRVVADLQPLVRLRRNDVKLEIGENLDYVVADPVQLMCALRTLVAHELHRVQDSTLRLELTREPGRGSDWMALFVEYPARELSLDQIEGVLAAFERCTDPHPPDGGLLALALAQRLAKQMGGHVAVESVPGAGTALAMRVPFDMTKVKVVPSRAPAPMSSPEPSMWSQELLSGSR
jgi:signal transduction histidine kinase